MHSRLEKPIIREERAETSSAALIKFGFSISRGKNWETQERVFEEEGSILNLSLKRGRLRTYKDYSWAFENDFDQSKLSRIYFAANITGSIIFSLLQVNVPRTIGLLRDEKRGPKKKEKSEWSRFVSIKVKRPHALLECKEILIRNVSRDQYFVQSWLMLDLRKGFSSCFFLFLLIIVSSFIKIVWKVNFSHERSGKKLKVRIYWFQGVTKSFNLEKIG